MSLMKIPTPGFSFLKEQSTAQVLSTVSTMGAPSGGVVLVTTSAAHGLNVGNLVTFDGITTPTVGYNDVIFKVLTVPTTATFTIQVGTLPQATFTTAHVDQVFLLGVLDANNNSSNEPGQYVVTTGANAVVQYNPTNDGLVQFSTTFAPTATPVWRAAQAVSSVNTWDTDGLAIRIVCNTANAGTTRWSQW